MYCPRCGQQAAEEVRFCSRCGLPLDDASALVEAGGRLAPSDNAAHAAAHTLTPRQRGTRKGVLIAAGGLLFFVLAALLTAMKGDLFVFMPAAALVFTAGVMRVLYGLLLEDDAARRKSPGPDAVDGHERRRTKLGRGGDAAELPPARARPASDFTKLSADTADMRAPASVAEATTKLLEKDA